MTTTQHAPAPTLGYTVTNSWPQVDLLPPEVRAQRRLKRTQRGLLLMVAGIVLLSLLGYAATLYSAVTAQTELDGVKQETAQLMAKQSKYAEVPQVLGGIAGIENARRAGTATEILWKPYIDAIRAVTPAGVSMDDLTVTTATPMLLAPIPIDPLAAASLGQISFNAKALTVPDTSDWLTALNSVPGLADAWFSTETRSDSNGVSYYQITVTVQVNDQALANRFAPEEGN